MQNAPMSETRDVWEAEYGYPDACEAYENLCEKVTAVGGANCAYFADVAARRGWSNVPDSVALAHLTMLAWYVLEPLREKLGRPILINGGYRKKYLRATSRLLALSRFAESKV